MKTCNSLQSSIARTLQYLPFEERLAGFSDGLDELLAEFKDEADDLSEGYGWLLELGQILADKPNPPPLSIEVEVGQDSSVQERVRSFLVRLAARTDLSDTLIAFREHLIRLTARYEKGLFHCYEIQGLPRTNNGLESTFGKLRARTKKTVGNYRSKVQLAEIGAWMLSDIIRNEQLQLANFQKVSLSEWKIERERFRLHRSQFTQERRFQRQPEIEFARLEARAAAIAAFAV